MTYYVGKPNVCNPEGMIEYVYKVLRSGKLTNNGEQVEAFEYEFANKHKFKYAVAVSNATVGLQLCLSGYPNGRIGLPAFSFIATLNAVKNSKLLPDFYDVDENMAINNSESRLTLPVNLFGSCVPEKFNGKNVAVYDSAHCTGMDVTHLKGAPHVFSLHATKLVNSCEGGMICTDNKFLADYLKAARNFGFDPNSEAPEGEILDIDGGTNAKMSEVHAAIGRFNLASVGEIIEYNKQIFKWYEEFLPEVNLFIPPESSNFSYIVMNFQPEVRERLYTSLRVMGVMVRKYFAYTLPKVAKIKGDFPMAERFSQTNLAFPTGMELKREDIEHICKLTRGFIND
jgi:dTDP-4-amino-4,6-dideoxygalactose transaminase